jgi:hypothetical protein
MIILCLGAIFMSSVFLLFSSFDPALLLHGQQYIEIYRPLPSCANVSSFNILLPNVGLKSLFMGITHCIGILLLDYHLIRVLVQIWVELFHRLGMN